MLYISTKIPKGVQIAIYPMIECTIAAGFMNPKYKKDPNHAFDHFGMDFDSLASVAFDVISSGVGTVLGVEFSSNNPLGGIVVIKYPKVYIPKTRKVRDLIFRYMHMMTVTVKKGQAVSAYSKIGTVGVHKWWNHLHVEVDEDVGNPFHTPQVAEASSKMLIRAGANTSTMIDPANILVVGKSQTAKVHPLAVYIDPKDVPRYKERDFVFEGSSALSQGVQKLILPVNNATITAGYKNTKYQTKFGFRHFGIDMIGQTTIYASGNGTVTSCGCDNILGNVIAIKYESVLNHKTGKTIDVIMRYNHLASLRIKSGQKVDKDTVLGVMGNTGRYSAGTHLHIEVDTDARETYACYTPTLSGNSNIMKAGQDTSFNPAEILYVKTSAPDRQSIKRLFDGYSSDADIDMPKIN